MNHSIRTVIRHLVATTLMLASCAAAAADPAKILHLATNDIDTLDPQQWQDVFSRQIGSSIFESLYEWDYLARPPGIVPNTALAAPQVSADGRTWTIRMKPGIYFTDDPAFRGKPRELVAEDYVYSIKRALDPNLRGGGDPITTDLIVGMRPVVDAARKPGAKFNYDAPVEGLRALDRFTLQLRLNEANFPAMTVNLALILAVAREVVEAAAGNIQTRVVGTGPYRLKEWKRGSRVVLEANPAYRAVAFPETSDPAYAALVREMKGKRLPQVGIVEFSVMEEMQTRLLEFERGKLDIVELRGSGAQALLKNGELDPELAARGIVRQVDPYGTRSVHFNMEDPVIGGMGKEHIALRRAIALGFDAAALSNVVYAGQAHPANQILPPGVSGFDPARPSKPRYDPAAANSLLDRFGYGNRGKDGFRLTPDGKPLVLTMTTFTGAVWTEMQTLWKRNMDAIGVRMEFRSVPPQDLFKEAMQGKFQLSVHGRSTSPMGLLFVTLYSKEPPDTNASRFHYDAYDRALEQYMRAPTNTERLAAARTMNDIIDSFVPQFPMVLEFENAFVHPWVNGYRHSPFATYYKYLDIDPRKHRLASGQR
jgi:oligopeptide transport system substrate-binding protein